MHTAPYHAELGPCASTQIKVLLGTSGDTRGPIAVYFGDSFDEPPESATYNDRTCSRCPHQKGMVVPHCWETFFNTDREDLDNLSDFVTCLVRLSGALAFGS